MIEEDFSVRAGLRVLHALMILFVSREWKKFMSAEQRRTLSEKPILSDDMMKSPTSRIHSKVLRDPN